MLSTVPRSPIPQLLRDAPQWSALPPNVLRCLAYYLRYEGVERPSDPEIRRALVALATAAKGL